jgi:hypothetical protein
VALANGCGQGNTVQELQLPQLVVGSWSHPIILDGSTVTIEGSGFLPESLVVYNLELKGPGVSLVIQPLQRLDDTHLEFEVTASFLAAVPPGSPNFSGNITLNRILFETYQQDSASLPVQFRVVSNMEPVITGFLSDEDVLYPGDEIHVTGNGFLLKGEGHTVIQAVSRLKCPPKRGPFKPLCRSTATTGTTFVLR